MPEVVIRGCIVQIEDPQFAREMVEAERERLQIEWEENNLME